MSQSVVEFRPVTSEAVSFIANTMRKEDVHEVWAAGHYSPLEAITSGLDLPGFSVVVWINDEPCAILGVVSTDPLSGIGVPWLLSSESALKYKSEFLRQSPPVIEEMLDICSTLYNYVHIDNKLSVRWLKWLGFSMDTAQPYGVDNELFYRFYMNR